MKPKEFADALHKAADLLPSNKATELHMLAELFTSSKAASVAATLTKVQKASAFTPTIGQPSIGDLLPTIGRLAAFASLYAKPALAKDLQSVSEFLQGFSRAGLGSFVNGAIGVLSFARSPRPTLKEEVVIRHLRRLEETLGDDAAFTAAHKGLDSDPDVGKLEVAEIAKRFTGKSASSRSVALKKIWARHHALTAFKAKSQSRDGRSAA